jgi:hypothetical protein
MEVGSSGKVNALRVNGSPGSAARLCVVLLDGAQRVCVMNVSAI